MKNLLSKLCLLVWLLMLGCNASAQHTMTVRPIYVSPKYSTYSIDTWSTPTISLPIGVTYKGNEIIPVYIADYTHYNQERDSLNKRLVKIKRGGEGSLDELFALSRDFDNFIYTYSYPEDIKLEGLRKYFGRDK